MERVGIFGGTFGPIHNGHLHAAEEFYRTVQLDRLYLMPACIPPHKLKDPSDSPEQRLTMVRLALEDARFSSMNVSACDWEITRRGKSYTFNTLTHFSAPERELYFLCGTDMFLTLDRWYRGTELFGLATMVCSVRENDPVKRDVVEQTALRYQKDYHAKTVILACDAVEMSSSEIRSRIRENLPVDAYVPKRVANYIEEQGLYREQEEPK